ncbi:MAG: hypothetical protein J0I12_31820 [Candidatus Eremiobacteraeota bacterium]|nr:hypothetical protein [Candidatus Eremiobacteraeota bacterium]
MSELDELIEGEFGEGLLDSRGSFSLSLAEAWKKMGASAGGHPLQWIVSCIQAFCAADSQSIYLIHKGAELWIVAHQPGGALRPREFLTLAGENLLARTPAGLLGRALAGALHQEPQGLLLCGWSDRDAQPEVAEFAPFEGLPGIRPLRPARGACLALYVRGRSKISDLKELLGYLFQFCPIGLHYVVQGMLLKSTTDVRSLHWVQQTPHCPLYAATEQTAAVTPLLIDCYQGESTSQVLFKPAHGEDVTYFAHWLNAERAYDWLRSPGLFDGAHCAGRYYDPPGHPAQKIVYSASKGLGNSGFGEKGSSQVTFVTNSGDFILMLEEKTGEDRILPIQHGATLKVLRGRLGIPGALVIAGAEGLNCDLGGLTLIEDERLEAWVEEMRERVRAALQQAVNEPPQARGGLSFWKTLGATSLTAAITVCLDGIQPEDLKMLGAVGLFGGSLLYTCLGFVRHCAPDSWFQRQTQDLQAELKRRLEAADR